MKQKHYESIAKTKSVPDDKTEVEVDNKSSKIQIMVKMFESEFASNSVRAPNKVSKKDIKDDTTGDTRKEIKKNANVSYSVRNAFDILMDSRGGNTIKTFGKSTKRLQKILSENGRSLESEIKLFNFSIFFEV